MKINCPNKGDPAFAAIAKDHGINRAYVAWNRNGGKIPEPGQVEGLLKRTEPLVPEETKVEPTKFSHATQAAIDAQSSRKLPVPLSPTEAAAIGKELGIQGDRNAVARELANRFGSKTVKKPNPKSESSFEKSEVIEDYGNGVTKHEMENGDVGWREAGRDRIRAAMKRVETKEAGGEEAMKNLKEDLAKDADFSETGDLDFGDNAPWRKNAKNREEMGHTVLFSELYDLAHTAFKAGGDFLKFVADVAKKLGSKIANIFQETALKETWESVIQVNPATGSAAKVDTLIKYTDLKDLQSKRQAFYSQQQAWKLQNIQDIIAKTARGGKLSETELASLRTEASALDKGGRMIANGLTPLYSEVEKIHPALRTAFAAREYFGLKADMDAKTRLKPFHDVLSKLNDDQNRRLIMAMSRGDVASQHAVMHEVGGSDAINTFEDTVTNHMPHLWASQSAEGIDLGKIDRYLPRGMKDMNAFGNYADDAGLKPYLEAKVKEQETKMGRQLADWEKEAVWGSALQRMGTGPTKPSLTKGRTIDSVTEDVAAFYKPLHASLREYMHGYGENIANARFFGFDAVTAYKNGGTPNAINPSSFIGAEVNRLVTEGKLKHSDITRLKELISARIGFKGDAGIARFIKGFNFLGVFTPHTALKIGVTEQVLSAAHNGLLPHLKGVKDAFSDMAAQWTGGRVGKYADVSMMELGMDSTFTINDPDQFLRKTNQFLAKVSGFTAAHRFIGDIGLNAPLHRLKGLGDTERMDELDQYQRYFTRPVADVAAEIKKGDYSSEDAKFIAYNQLTKVRPTSLSSMPVGYLRNNGVERLMYNLRSWGIFQLDAIKKGSLDKMNAGDYKGGMTGLLMMGGMLVMANASAEKTVDAILGRDISWKDREIDSVLKVFLMSRYSNEKLFKTGDVQSWANSMAGVANVPLASFMSRLGMDSMAANKDETGAPWYQPFINDSSLMSQLPTMEATSMAYWRYGHGADKKKVGYAEKNLSEQSNKTLELVDYVKANPFEAETIHGKQWADQIRAFGHANAIAKKIAEHHLGQNDPGNFQGTFKHLDMISTLPMDQWKHETHLLENELKTLEKLKAQPPVWHLSW